MVVEMLLCLDYLGYFTMGKTGGGGEGGVLVKLELKSLKLMQGKNLFLNVSN